MRQGDRGAAPAALNVIEDRSPRGRDQARALLAAVGTDARSHLIGLTGPPGAGKSSLLSALLPLWRGSRRSVAVLAVDPSSKVSGGSLLGDRVRIQHDPRDDGVLIRSTATGTRLGGLAEATRDAAQALASAFDIVVVETVGVGQSETDVAELCDTVAVIVQPGSGDTLQFLKAGIMEVPDVLVVTKADMGDAAMRTRRDLAGALRTLGSRQTPVVAVASLPPPQGVDQLLEALDAHRDSIDIESARARMRRLAALSHFATEYGEHGLREVGGRRAAERRLAEEDPARTVPELVAVLESARDRR